MSSRNSKARQHRQAITTMRAVCKQPKRNRKPDRVRHRDWLRVDLSNPDTIDELEGAERVMPRGERERRRATLVALAEMEDEGPAEVEPANGEELVRGVVTQVSTGLCRVETGGGSLLCGLRGARGGAGGARRRGALSELPQDRGDARAIGPTGARLDAGFPLCPLQC